MKSCVGLIKNLGFCPESDKVPLKGFKPGNGMIRFAFRKMSLATGFRKAKIVGKEDCC